MQEDLDESSESLASDVTMLQEIIQHQSKFLALGFP
jgi:hypothetical protein